MAGPRNAPARPDRSMSLLVDMMSGTLDDGYRRAAEARGGRAPARRPATTRVTAWTSVLAVLGLLTGTAVAQVRERAREIAGTRAELARTVAERTERSDALQSEADAARDALSRVREEALGAGAAGREATARVAELELAAAAVPVTGPGLVVVLDDAPEQPVVDGDPRAEAEVSGRVLDRDVQDAVNGLWAAGAEAVAVDGLRLGALTAVRSAGELVLVDFRPVTPPYVLEAVGDPAALEEGLAATGTRARLQALREAYGIGVEVRREDDLSLAAARLPDLRAVEVP